MTIIREDAAITRISRLVMISWLTSFFISIIIVKSKPNG